MKILLLLPLLLGFSVPAIAHNEANGGEDGDAVWQRNGIPVNWCALGKRPSTHCCFKTDKCTGPVGG